jgi:hypothetical protein
MLGAVARGLWLILAAAMVCLALAATPANAARPTHSVSIKGELVDRWSIDDPEECGRVGSGTLTVTFQTASLRVIPFIDRFQRGGKGSWIIGVPIGLKGVRDAPYIKATGTITREDNTTRRPRASGTPCDQSKPGCGAFPLRKPRGLVGRHDRRHVAVKLATEQFELITEPSCLSGALSGWSTPRLSGGTREGDLLVRMPKPSTLKRRRKVVVTDTSHKTTTLKDPLTPGSATTTDDVTRKATVTFKRL